MLLLLFIYGDNGEPSPISFGPKSYHFDILELLVKLDKTSISPVVGLSNGVSWLLCDFSSLASNSLDHLHTVWSHCGSSTASQGKHSASMYILRSTVFTYPSEGGFKCCFANSDEKEH